MQKILIAAAAVVTLAACQTTAPPREKMTFPQIGAVSTEGVGDILLTQGASINAGAINIPSDQNIGQFVVRKGKYIASRSNKKVTIFQSVTMRLPGEDADKLGKLFLFAKDNDTKMACVTKEICGELNYSVEKVTQRVEKNYFQQTLIYNGKVGDKITLGYREFKGDWARPAFSNEVTYDLSTSKVLGYKGARLEVISATNTDLTYKVLSDFN
ncbi:MAG: hypothetical protein V4484_21005 [Pseudomonadota bacterium]